VNNKELIKFGKDYSTLRDRKFLHSFAHIFGQTDRVFMKILQ